MSKEWDGVRALDKPAIVVDSGDILEGVVPKIASADVVMGCLYAFNGLSGPCPGEVGTGKRNSDSGEADLVSLSPGVDYIGMVEASSFWPDAG